MKLTLLEIRQFYSAFAALDGKEKLFGKIGEEKIIKESYKFSSNMKWDIVENLDILDVHVKRYNKVRDDLIKQIAGDSNEIGPHEKEKIKEFSDKINEIDQREIDVEGLISIYLQEFNLEKNDIPGTVLFALKKLIKRSPIKEMT